MAAITAANVVVTLNPEDIDRSPDGRVGIRTFPTVQFGNGVLTYPALGVPMPAIGKFGFHFAIKRAYVENPGNGYIYSFDRTNHKVRIWLGAARDAITVANHVGVAPTGNVAIANHVGVAPTGNVAATPAVSGGTPSGNLANLVAATHSHDLTVLANGAGAGTSTDGVGVNAANQALVSETATGAVISGGNVANKGGVGSTTPGNSTGAFVGDALATHVHGAQAFTGDAPANFVHGATFTGDAPSNFTHNITGGGAVAEAPLAEMDNTVAPASVTLAMEMVGK
jgi:hypothetical protein